MAERRGRHGAGDVQGGADYRPTDASMQILDMLEKELAEAQRAFDTVIEKDVPAFNKAHAGKKSAEVAHGFSRALGGRGVRLQPDATPRRRRRRLRSPPSSRPRDGAPRQPPRSGGA